VDGAGLVRVPDRRNQAAASAPSRRTIIRHRYRVGGEASGATGCGLSLCGAAEGNPGVFGKADMSGA